MYNKYSQWPFEMQSAFHDFARKDLYGYLKYAGMTDIFFTVLFHLEILFKRLIIL